MNSDTLERLHDILAEALERPPQERAAFLDQACGSDVELRAEAGSLLDHQPLAGAFLEAPAYSLVDGDLDDPNAGELKPGETLGDCRIISLLGEGGMGEVYLAEDTKLERRVAIKLLKRRLDDASLMRRFRHERKVLATLTHPNIARLYDGGTTPEGRSYLVMEYVEGERLDRYCERQGIGVSERLTLFRKACTAVSYAHQNLVVHRDLKPANIRVTPEGEPKLLDFGIAKLLDPEGASTAGQSDPTMTLHTAMTPEYASPEQLRGEAITTASDVYSLGVVLYELLCGQRPYALKSRRPDELAHAICEQEPPRPSTVASRTAPTTATGTVPAGQVPDFRQPAGKLRRLLEGDLDNIAAKALRKEPERRYASVAALSEDLRRHCEGLPVTARKDTLGYRAGKFVRRNKVGMAAAAAVMLTLIGGLIITIWQARVAEKERDRARAAQSQAEAAQRQSELARKQAERLNGFLQTLLGSANPSKGPGRDLKVVQVLDQASAQLDRELAGEPALLAQAHQTLGQAYAGLQETEPALRHLRTALVLNRQVYGEDHIVTARSKAALGTTILYQQRTNVEAETLLRDAIAVERRQSPVDQAELLKKLLVQCRMLYLSNRFEQAITQFSETTALARQAFGEESEPYADCMEAMGMLRINQGDYAGAEEPLRRSVAICRRLPPPVILFPWALADLAYDLLLQGKSDEPETILHEAMDLIRTAVGEDTLPYQFDTALLGFMYYEREDYPAAVREMRPALEFLIPRYAKDDEDMVGGRVVLGLSLMHEGRPTEGEPFLNDALEISRANHMTGLLTAPAVVRSSLIECLAAEKKYAAVEPLLLAQHSELSQKFGARDPHTTETARKLHDLYTILNKPEQAALYPGTEITAPPSRP